MINIREEISVDKPVVFNNLSFTLNYYSQIGNVVLVKKFYGNYIKLLLDRLWFFGVGVISPYYEPLGEVDEEYELTEKVIDVLVTNGLPVYINTSLRVGKVLEYVLLHNSYNKLVLNIPCLDGKIFNHLYPENDGVKKLIKHLFKLAGNGLNVGVRLNPTLDDFKYIKSFIRLLDKSGCKFFEFKCMDVSNFELDEIYIKLTRFFKKERLYQSFRVFNHKSDFGLQIPLYQRDTIGGLFKPIDNCLGDCSSCFNEFFGKGNPPCYKNSMFKKGKNFEFFRDWSREFST